MQFSISSKYRMLPTLVIFAALAVMSSVASILLLGELVIPIASAALSAVFVLEQGRSRVFSIIAPIVILVTDVVFRGALSYLALEIILVALVLSVCFLRKSKGECAFWLTLVATAFSVVAMALAAYAETRQLSFDSFIDFYLGWYQEIENVFLESFSDISILFGITSDAANEEVGRTVLRSLASIVPSIVIICSFVLSGFSLKFQSLMLRSVAEDDTKKRIAEWRFSLSTPIYYAFWIVLLLNFFTEFSKNVSVYSITVVNIYNVLLYVFAYLGIGVVLTMLEKLFKSRRLAKLAIVGAILLFSGLAIELIAYFGASVVFYNKRITDGDK